MGGRERSAMSSGCRVPGALWVPLVPLGRTNRRSCEASFFLFVVTEALTLAQSAQDQFNEPRMKKGQKRKRNDCVD